MTGNNATPDLTSLLSPDMLFDAWEHLDPNTIFPNSSPATWVMETGISRVQDAISERLTLEWARDPKQAAENIIHAKLTAMFTDQMLNVRGRVSRVVQEPEPILVGELPDGNQLFGARYGCFLFRDSTQSTGETQSSLVSIDYVVLVWAQQAHETCSMSILIGPAEPHEQKPLWWPARNK